MLAAARQAVPTVDEKCCITTVVHKQLWTLATGPGQTLLCAPPVLLECLTLPGKNGSRVASDSGRRMVLQGSECIKSRPQSLADTI